MFSGLYPDRHGVRENDSFKVPKRENRKYALLAEKLEGAGFQTAAFVSAQPMERRFGLAAGFDHWDEPDTKTARGGGQRFRERPAAETAAKPDKMATAGAEGATVLYVEDNPANILFMRDLLGEYEGIELVTAASAEIGIELARSSPPAVIIMDVNLPGMSGVEALRVLKTIPETREVPVIALTAAVSERDRKRAEQAESKNGARDHDGEDNVDAHNRIEAIAGARRERCGPGREHDREDAGEEQASPAPVDQDVPVVNDGNGTRPAQLSWNCVQARYGCLPVHGHFLPPCPDYLVCHS